MPPPVNQKTLESVHQISSVRETLINPLMKDLGFPLEHPTLQQQINILAVWITMLYPQESLLRKKHATVIIYRDLLGVVKTIPSALSSTETQPFHNGQLLAGDILLSLPSEQQVLDHIKEAGRRGGAAGNVLLVLAHLVHIGIKEPGFRKALFVTGQIYKEMKFGDGSQLAGLTEKSLRGYWKEYKLVAHFWAAYSYCLQSNDHSLWKADTQVFGPTFPTFLGIAEWFRNFGIGFRASRSKKLPSLFDEATQCWLPDDYPVPLYTPTLTDLDGTMAALLKSYQKNYQKKCDSNG